MERFGGPGPDDGQADPLSWTNVALAAALLAINVAISSALGLQLSKQVVVAGIRCFVQLTVLGLVLKPVFATDSPAIVFAITVVLGGLAALEVARWRGKRSVKGMFWIALVSILGSALVIGVVGAAFVMDFTPLYRASKFIPMVGMLFGNTMVGVSLGMESVLEAVDARRETVETQLCYGASRWEAVRPIAVEAARMAMLPTITMVGITGLIAIPGMMTGQILGGAPVMDAARYQQIILFMIMASVALGVVTAVVATAFVVVDGRPQLRTERIVNKAQRAGGSAGGEPLTPGTVGSRSSIANLKQWRERRRRS